MKINEILITELKKYIDPNNENAWINVNGKIDNVKTHPTWLYDKYKSFDAHGKAFSEGWVRVKSSYDVFYIEGKQKNIKRTFKWWWPSAIDHSTVVIENYKNMPYSKVYYMPENKSKLLKDFGPDNANK